MKFTFKRATALLLAVLMALSLLSACGSNKDNTNNVDTDTTQTETTKPAEDDVDGELIVDHDEDLQYAKFFTMTHYKGGYISFQIIGGQEDDWIYLIVPEGKSVPADLGDEYVVLQQPMDKIRCDSGTAAVIAAFGGLDHVATINTELSGIAVESVAAKMESGDIKFSGSYKEPDYEILTAEETQLVIDTNMLDSLPEVKEKYNELGIPFFVTRNSKEVHPLGHVEWAKVYGAILGMWDEANAYFEEQVKLIDSVSNLEDTGKTVAMAYFSSDGTKVYARRGGDHYAAMIDMAGGNYAMAGFDPEDTGVATITLEDFFSLCSEADIFINMNMAAKLYTMDEMLEFVPIMKDFKAVKEGNVYACREKFSQFSFDNAAIITDMHTIMTDSTADTTYFTKMKFENEVPAEAPAADDTKADEKADTKTDADVDGQLIVDHEEKLQYAQSFRMTHYKGGYISFQFLGGTDEHLTYLVVPEGKSVPTDLSNDYVVIQQPVNNVRACAGSAATINAFGGLSKVTNASMQSDAMAVTAVANAMNAGKIQFSGASKTPDYEMITDLGTQVVFDNNYSSGNAEVTEKFSELGIPCLCIRSSKETHPLGYNEWAKVYGAVLGMWDEANAYFNQCVSNVNALSSLKNTGKTVALVYFSSDGSKMYIPRGGDCWGKLAELAGGVYATKDTYAVGEVGTGTVSLEEGFALLSEADYIFNLNMGGTKQWNLEELLTHVPLLADCKAVKENHAFIAIDRIYQFNYDYAGMIKSMNAILTDDSVKETTYFYLAE